MGDSGSAPRIEKLILIAEKREKTMKKWMTVLLCTLLCVSLLSGCVAPEHRVVEDKGSASAEASAGCKHVSWSYMNEVACKCDNCGEKQAHSWVTNSQGQTYCEYCFTEKQAETQKESAAAPAEQTQTETQTETQVEESTAAAPETATPGVINTSITTSPVSDAPLQYMFSVKQVSAPQCIPNNVMTSSEVSGYGADLAIDGDTSTCWKEGASSGWGDGESITVAFDGPQSLYYISFFLGDQKDSSSYYANGRPKSLLLEFSDGEKLTCDFEDRCSGWQTFLLSHKVVTTWVKVTIQSVYAGSDTSAKATGISEMCFYSFEETNSFKVVYNGVRIRSGAGSSYEQIATMNVGETFTVEKWSSDNEWMKFSYYGREAWIWLPFSAPASVSFY